MNNFVKKLAIVALIICLYSDSVSGCAKYVAPKQEFDDDISTFEFSFLREHMKTCLNDKVENIGVLVDFFVIHSEWFSSVVDCQDSNCAFTKFKELFYYDPAWLDTVKTCMEEYETLAKGSTLRRKRHATETYVHNIQKRDTGRNQVLCPKLTTDGVVAEMNEMSKSITKQITTTGDTTFTHLKDLLIFFNQMTVKPEKASCAKLYRNANFLIEGEPQLGLEGCDRCNSLKLGAMFKKDSAFGKTYCGTMTLESQSSGGTCAPTMRLRVDHNMLRTLGVTSIEDELIMGDHKFCTTPSTLAEDLLPQCRASVVTSISRQKHALFDVPLDKCGIKKTKFENDETKEYHYEATITFVPQFAEGAVIGRFKCSTLKFTCVIPQSRTATVGQFFKPTAYINEDATMETETSYPLDFNLYHKDTKIDATQLEVGEVVEGVVTLKKPDPNIQLLAGKCWASKSSSSSDLSAIYPIVDCVGCPAKNDVDEENEKPVVIQNGVGQEAKFSFKTFLWLGVEDEADQIIYVHCKVQVCVKNAKACPIANCDEENTCPSEDKRKRRSLLSEEGEDEEKTVSFGPLHVVNTKSRTLQQSGDVEHHQINKCLVNNGGCEDVCTEEKFGMRSAVRCSCYLGRTLNGDGQSCSPEPRSVSQRKGRSSSYFNNPIVIGMAAFATIIMSATIITYIRSEL